MCQIAHNELFSDSERVATCLYHAALSLHDTPTSFPLYLSAKSFAGETGNINGAHAVAQPAIRSQRSLLLKNKRCALNTYF